MTAPGGRIPPDGRPPQAKGTGKNAKRHDLERPATPGLSDSDLQQGDVQALEQGQRIAPRTTQQPAAPQPSGSIQPTGSATAPGVPDAIDFLGGIQTEEFNVPQTGPAHDNDGAIGWMQIVRELAAGPGSSPGLAGAMVEQLRTLSKGNAGAAAIVDMDATDEAIEAMLDEGV